MPSTPEGNYLEFIERIEPSSIAVRSYTILVLGANMPKLAANLSMMFNEVGFMDRFGARRRIGIQGC